MVRAGDAIASADVAAVTSAQVKHMKHNFESKHISPGIVEEKSETATNAVDHGDTQAPSSAGVEQTAGDGVEDMASLRALTDAIREKLGRMVGDIIAVGQDLHKAKDLVGHGRFGAYLDTEFRMSERTAERYMAVAERFAEKSDTVSHLPATLVYKLAAKSTSETVVREVIARADEGSPMTAEEVRQRLARHRTAREVARTPRLVRPLAAAFHTDDETVHAVVPDAEVSKVAQEAAALLREALGEQLEHLLDLLEACDLREVVALLREPLD